MRQVVPNTYVCMGEIFQMIVNFHVALTELVLNLWNELIDTLAKNLQVACSWKNVFVCHQCKTRLSVSLVGCCFHLLH